MAPRSLPEKSLSEPINFPTGVWAPATITDRRHYYLQRLYLTAQVRRSPARDLSRQVTVTFAAEQSRRPPLVATALVTAIDHVGIAVPDLDAAIKWYHDHLGMIVLHEEVNEDQGIREAMLSVVARRRQRPGPADGAA